MKRKLISVMKENSGGMFFNQYTLSLTTVISKMKVNMSKKFSTIEKDFFFFSSRLTQLKKKHMVLNILYVCVYYIKV